MEGDIRQVQPLGLLGCQFHHRPYVIWEVETVPGASRRFLFLCPVPECGQGIRVTSRQTVSVCVSQTPSPHDPTPTPIEEQGTTDEAVIYMDPCPSCAGRGAVRRPRKGEAA